MSLKMPVRVSIDHYVDASDTDADGMHDWHYEYDVYRFSRGWRIFVARAYLRAKVEIPCPFDP